jgi:hypothetical protein
MWETLKLLGLTREKKLLRAAEQDRPQIADVRSACTEPQYLLNADRLVFLKARPAIATMGWRAPRATRNDTADRKHVWQGEPGPVPFSVIP